MSSFSCEHKGWWNWLLGEHRMYVTFHVALWDTFSALYRVQRSSLNIWTLLQNGINLIKCPLSPKGSDLMIVFHCLPDAVADLFLELWNASQPSVWQLCLSADSWIATPCSLEPFMYNLALIGCSDVFWEWERSQSCSASRVSPN